MSDAEFQSHVVDGPVRRVLVVDDSLAQRRLLRRLLESWGYEVHEAADGAAALTHYHAEQVDIVICDWMMPGMSGPELFRALRKVPNRSYVYLLMLTSRTETVEGLEAGADEFLIKPPKPDTLRARLRTGERILSLQERLLVKQRDVAAARDRLQHLYDTLDQDLLEAAKLQAALLPEREACLTRAHIAIKVQPAGHVGGDLVGYFEASGRVVAYAIDISGHGVSSALLAARVSAMFGQNGRDRDMIFDGDRLREPGEIATLLNEAIVSEIDTDLYFTMALAKLDPATGDVTCVQAGHPPPAILKRNGKIRFEGSGGPPVGLLEGLAYKDFRFRLFAGERLFLFSDGLTEAETPDGQEMGNKGFGDILTASSSRPSAELLDDVIWRVSSFTGGSILRDDMSILMLTYLDDAGLKDDQE